MAPFALHEKAIEAFEKRAEEFFERLESRPIVPEQSKQVSENSLQHKHSVTLTEEDLVDSDLFSGHVDTFGRRTSYCFPFKSSWVGLFDDEYRLFRKEVEKLAGRPELRDLVSDNYIEQLWFRWFQRRYGGSKDVPFYSFLLAEAAGAVKAITVAIPVEHLGIESPFQVGHILFKYLRKQDFDEFSAALATQIEDEVDLAGIVEQQRKRYQGVVLATITVTAEQEKAVEVAYRETALSLDALRLFSPTVWLPEITCFTEVRGRVLTPTKDFLILELPHILANSRVDVKEDLRWDIPDFLFDKYREMGLPLIEALISKADTDRTDLEQKLISCLSLFSRSLCSNAFHDKMVFMLVTLESLLLANSTEPIQSSISLRLAHLVCERYDDRKNLLRVVRECYDIRSKYLHHGKTGSDDLENLRQLQHAVQTAILNVASNVDKLKTKEELIENLNMRILG